jgi:3-oxoacyl-[acyl-carrier protein] reductase
MLLTGLKGRTAVVTGAGRTTGIGVCIARSLAQSGCSVVVVGSNRAGSGQGALSEELQAVVDDLSAAGGQARGCHTDLTSSREVEALWDVVRSEFGGASFLVNNAAAGRGDDRQPVATVPFAEWARVTRGNLDMTFLMSQAFIRLAPSPTAIVNVSSISARYFPESTSAYAASKSGVQALTKVMAREAGAAGIRVNAVCPGLVETPRMGGYSTTPAGREFIAHTPLGRAGTVEDIAPIVTFLCSDQGRWITGQTINADGGYAIEP